MKDNYSKIFKLISEAGFKLTVRLHYAINDSLKTADTQAIVILIFGII